MDHSRYSIQRFAFALVWCFLWATTVPGETQPIHRLWLPFIAEGGAVDYYVDNSGADGDGSFGNPWNNIAGHVNDLAASDTMHVRGNASLPARVYIEAEIDITVSGGVGNRITLRPYQNELVTIKNDGPPPSHYTFDIHGAYWTIQDFEISHNGSYAYGIYVRGSNTILRDNEIHNGKAHNIVVDNGITDTEIRDNTMYDFILAATDAHGVMTQINTDRTIIDGNTIYNCSGDAVQLHDGGWAAAADSPTDCEITNNVCYRGTNARAEDGIDIKCSANLTVSGNDFSGYGRAVGDAGGSGVGTTNQTHTGLTIRDNIIHNCKDAIRFHSTVAGVNGTVYRNLIYDISRYGLFVFSGGAALDIYNNTIVDAVQFGLRVSGSGWTGGNLKNNLWWNSGHLTKDAAAPFGATADYNGRWDTTSDAAFVGANDTTGIGDPGFVNAAADDYRLLVTSNAVDAGVNAGLPFYGPAPDLGYWEYRGATTTTSTTTTTSISITTTTTTLYDPYADALIVNCATALRMSEPLTVAQVIERNAIAAVAQGL